MCGRTCCTLNAGQVARACGLRNGDADSVRTVHMDRFRPSYNVSPGAYLPVFMVGSKSHAAQVGQPCHTVHCMKWGLVPSFTKKTEKPDHYRMFNARSESVKEKASFRRLIPNNRCLVAVDGFYEWKKDGSKKQPYYIHFSDGRPLVFAALYDSWENSDGEILYTFTILTTRSSSALEWLHDRMPVVFGSKSSIDMWLSNSSLKLDTVLAPYTGFDLVWYPVTSAMGKPSFEGPECIKKITLKPDVQNQISKLFSRKTDENNKCKRELECEKPTDDDDKPNNLKEEPATEDAAELADEKKDESDYFSSTKKEIVGQGLRGVKREFEDLGPDLEIKSEMQDACSTSVKKKLQTEDKQVSLLSYFGRK